MNKLTSLPSTFNQLQNLKYLSLEYNNFSEFPDVICSLTNLTSLDMATNKISTIPLCIKNLIQLESVNISMNLISDLSSLNHLPKLKKLFAFNNLIEEIPDTFETLDLLEVLNLSDNKIHQITDIIGKLLNIRELYLNKNAIRSVSHDITKLEILSILDLNNNLLYEIPDLNLNTVEIDIEENPLSSSYILYRNTVKEDLTFYTFHEMMNKFPNNKTTIFNKTNGYITDSILKQQRNPYIVHFEDYGGRSYPIITILKGTMLFTAREIQSPSFEESFFHLYKLHGNSTLNDYNRNNFEDVMTYFFPIPFMAPVVGTDYTTMDMVTLTKDIRLLCLISPSPITRGDKNNIFDNLVDANNDTYYSNNFMNVCSNRDYDLCISRDLINGLKLNGYIGIAYLDSLCHPENADIIKEMTSKVDYKNSLIYLASCFNNATYKDSSTSIGNNFVEKMIDARTYGIPEIVIIPYDIHNYNNPTSYENVYNTFINSIQNNLEIKDKNVINHFLFKYHTHVNGNDTFEVADMMGKELNEYKKTGLIRKSLQAYPLLNVLTSEFDSSKRSYLFISDNPITLNDVSYPNSYINKPKSKCAFETLIFYKMLEEANADIISVGGSSTLFDTKPILLKTAANNINININKDTSNSNIISKPQEKIKIQMNKAKNRKIVTDRFYYNEVSDIPIFSFKKRPPTNKKLGGKKYKYK